MKYLENDKKKVLKYLLIYQTNKQKKQNNGSKKKEKRTGHSKQAFSYLSPRPHCSKSWSWLFDFADFPTDSSRSNC
ncbi:hypothetical protein BpHYR1_003083 [Brachionus plicatilis]|uniref:Uncharacterized protein n=1 Tax=Brachionus plicatilis TaxID=10195 RepID=A0A3M7QMQ0_BRAPC|nr:hypothetical protein BpHYR1_003083 [Brachionus plicatilis]